MYCVFCKILLLLFFLLDGDIYQCTLHLPVKLRAVVTDYLPSHLMCSHQSRDRKMTPYRRRKMIVTFRLWFCIVEKLRCSAFLGIIFFLLKLSWKKSLACPQNYQWTGLAGTLSTFVVDVWSLLGIISLLSPNALQPKTYWEFKVHCVAGNECKTTTTVIQDKGRQLMVASITVEILWYLNTCAPM